MPEELHISSIIVQMRPELADNVAARVAHVDGAELHQWVAPGKLIVTLETATTHEIMQRIELINDLPGVISTSLVYHQWEPVNQAENEADHDTHAPQVSQG